mgnify:CR=1 FL=1
MTIIHLQNLHRVLLETLCDLDRGNPRWEQLRHVLRECQEETRAQITLEKQKIAA